MQSQLSPLRRLAQLRRAPFWAQALALCALFAVAGVAALDDYGIGSDGFSQRRYATANAAYITTGDISGLSQAGDVGYRYYGVAFGMPLLLVERALGLQDIRHIFIARHLLTHMFFISGGFACGMLAYRMLGSRWIALLAIMMFLLHPRLYAHSFFNVKDIPFVAMLAIALYLAHRAFRKNTIGAFLLCGIGAGLAISLRPFGLMLLPMILAMRAADLWQASGEERKRILMTGAAFFAAVLATTYIVHPYYWENPLRFVEGVRVMSQYPTIVDNLFMGKIYTSDAVPWNYIPVWFAITSPPVALSMGAVGAAAVCCQGIARPLAALRDREIRFRILLLGCFALPVVAVIALQSNTYNGWRHMYFLWAPFCMLAAVGLGVIANSNVGKSRGKVAARLPGWVRSGGPRRALAYSVAGVGLITTLTAMAALHPNQQVYFNALVDTQTSGAPGNRYDMDYWHVAQRQSLEYLLARYPDGALRVYPGIRSGRILPQSDRERIAFSPPHDADFYIKQRANRWNGTEEPAIHSVRAYGGAIAVIIDPSADGYRDYYRAAYNDIAANGTLLTRADFDIYAYNGALYYLKENCAPALEIAPGYYFFLKIFPADPANLPVRRHEFGHVYQNFNHTDSFGYFDGRCITRQPLPDYPFSLLRTGRYVGTEELWSADIDLVAHAAAQALHKSIAAGNYGQPAAQSDFGVYMSGGRLAYLKETCAAGDADARFFLHIFPSDPADLPADMRERGFENMDFQFVDHGAYAGYNCVAERELPEYPIERIRTGQFVIGGDRLWAAEFPAGR